MGNSDSSNVAAENPFGIPYISNPLAGAMAGTQAVVLPYRPPTKNEREVARLKINEAESKREIERLQQLNEVDRGRIACLQTEVDTLRSRQRPYAGQLAQMRELCRNVIERQRACSNSESMVLKAVSGAETLVYKEQLYKEVLKTQNRAGKLVAKINENLPGLTQGLMHTAEELHDHLDRAAEMDDMLDEYGRERGADEIVDDNDGTGPTASFSEEELALLGLAGIEFEPTQIHVRRTGVDARQFSPEVEAQAEQMLLEADYNPFENARIKIGQPRMGNEFLLGEEVGYATIDPPSIRPTAVAYRSQQPSSSSSAMDNVTGVVHPAVRETTQKRFASSIGL